MKKDRDEILFGDTRIEYSIIRRPTRTTTAITVHPDRTIEVVAPKGTRKKAIAPFVRSRATWIIKQQVHFARLHVPKEKAFVNGESFQYLGRQYQFKMLPIAPAGSKPQVSLRAGKFFVEVPKRWSVIKRKEAAKEALISWYREHAKERIAERAAYFSKQLGIETPKTFVRDQQKRWGSCNKKGELRFNWRIVMAPMLLVDYVVAHELCHLFFYDHSTEFWSLLRKIMPDYEKRRRLLEKTGVRYRF